jgi:hypothetical protein
MEASKGLTGKMGVSIKREIKPHVRHMYGE